jgi:hypothetical protein
MDRSFLRFSHESKKQLEAIRIFQNREMPLDSEALNRRRSDVAQSLCMFDRHFLTFQISCANAFQGTVCKE